MEYFLQAQYNTWLHWFLGFGFLLLLLEFIVYDDVVVGQLNSAAGKALD